MRKYISSCCRWQNIGATFLGSAAPHVGSTVLVWGSCFAKLPAEVSLGDCGPQSHLTEDAFSVSNDTGLRWAMWFRASAGSILKPEAPFGGIGGKGCLD